MKGFMVFERYDDYEQALVLRTGNGLPPGGILDWARGPREYRTVFSNRSDAVKAINRTSHYRLAYGELDRPQKEFCVIIPVRAIDAAEKELGA